MVMAKKRNPSKKVLKKILATSDRQKRLKIIKALARITNNWTNYVLLEIISDPCENIRDFIISELGRRKNLDLDLIYNKLTTPPWFVKSSCLRLLGIKKDLQSVKYIRALIEDPNADVRITAAQTLGEIGGEESLALLARLIQDKNHFVKASAEKAMEKVSHLKFS